MMGASTEANYILTPPWICYENSKLQGGKRGNKPHIKNKN
jgi:hypothetical protein